MCNIVCVCVYVVAATGKLLLVVDGLVVEITLRRRNKTAFHTNAHTRAPSSSSGSSVKVAVIKDGRSRVWGRPPHVVQG